MHAVFYITGMRRECEEYLKFLETRFLLLPFENPRLHPSLKDKDGSILARGEEPMLLGIRYGIFGTYEAIFPENEKNKVLTLLRFNKEVHSFSSEVRNGRLKNAFLNAGVKLKIASLRKAMGLEKPEFEEDKSIWIPEYVEKHVRIIPVGIRKDAVHEFPNGVIKEAL